MSFSLADETFISDQIDSLGWIFLGITTLQQETPRMEAQLFNHIPLKKQERSPKPKQVI